jgi:hypothetical protein
MAPLASALKNVELSKASGVHSAAEWTANGPGFSLKARLTDNSRFCVAKSTVANPSYAPYTWSDVGVEIPI